MFIFQFWLDVPYDVLKERGVPGKKILGRGVECLIIQYDSRFGVLWLQVRKEKRRKIDDGPKTRLPREGWLRRAGCEGRTVPLIMRKFFL